MPDKRLDRGIWKTSYGFRVILRINGQLERKSFPPTYTLEALRRWRDDHVRLLRHQKRRGTLTEDVRVYLEAVAAMPSITDRTREINAWLPAFGDMPRWKITSDRIRAQLHAWRLTAAASTVNHRRTALGHLYTVLDGKSAPNPVRDVPPFPEPPALRRGQALPICLAAIRRVRGRYTRVRLLLLLWTGLRPAELMRLTPELVNLDEEVCWVPTAKGGKVRPVVLNRSAMKAFRRFMRLDAWGPFSTASVRKILVKAAKRDPPLAIRRVYDLRHSFSTALRRHADLADVQAHLGHSTPRMTERYAPTELLKLRMATAAIRKIQFRVPVRQASVYNSLILAGPTGSKPRDLKG